MSASNTDVEIAGRLVVLHDGECSFCTFWVRQLAHWDGRDRLRFLPLGSARGRALAARHTGIDPDSPASVIATDHFEEPNEVIRLRSAAVLRIVAELDWRFRALLILRIFPRRLLDAGYDFVARRRKSLPGAEVCVLSDPELTRRLLR